MKNVAKQFLTRSARRVAPRTTANIRMLSTLDQQFDQGPARFLNYERELRTLRREIDALRRDNRRVAELYDAVFEWAKADAAERGVAPAVDATVTMERVAAELADTATVAGSTDTADAAVDPVDAADDFDGEDDESN